MSKQWTRHHATMSTDAGVQIVCARCGLVLPLVAKLGSIVLTREDRCYLGDHERAVDCAV